MRNGREIDPAQRRLEQDRHPPLRHLSAAGAPATRWAIVKFTFPNKHAVYMHDTPTKDLFDADEPHVQPRLHARAQPAALAEVLLGRGQGLGRRNRSRV